MISSITIYRLIGQVGRVFASGPGDRVQSQVESYQRFKKWYLIFPCIILFTNPSAQAGYDTTPPLGEDMTQGQFLSGV